MTRRAAALLLLLLVAAVSGLILLTGSDRDGRAGRRPRTFLRVSPEPALTRAAVPGRTVTPVETIRITLFFLDAQATRLEPEERDIPKPAGAGAFLKAIFSELQRGPKREGLVGAIPSRMQLRTAFLLPEGEVVLDLAVDAGLSFGSTEELAIIASLVNTTLQNVADTTRVRILINGEPAETLGGHVDLTRPLLAFRGELGP